MCNIIKAILKPVDLVISSSDAAILNPYGALDSFLQQLMAVAAMCKLAHQEGS